MPAPTLFIVAPCYNEETVLPITSTLFKSKIESLAQRGEIAADSRVLFVNDGSKDNTWDIIQDLAKQDEVFEGISLSRNRGHQNALTAGLFYAMSRCDVTISIDADGQDDINVMDCFLQKYKEGAEVVYGVRSSRKTDTGFKRITAQGFYKVMALLGAETVYNHADYRLLSKRALQGLSQFKERNLFLRGTVPLVGLKSAVCEYERAERMAGESKYPLSKMLALAVNGITSLSVKPLRLITGIGLLVSLFSFLGALWALIAWATGHTISGWTSMTVALFFLSGIQLLSLGVIGEYIGKIYSETKERPLYLIADSTLKDSDEDKVLHTETETRAIR